MFIIGLLESIQSGALTPEECEVLLFNPYMKQKLSQLNISEDILKSIACGMELDDIKILTPNALYTALGNMKDDCVSSLKKHTKINYPINRYFEV